jgi:hypothetical protein
MLDMDQVTEPSGLQVPDVTNAELAAAILDGTSKMLLNLMLGSRCFLIVHSQ